MEYKINTTELISGVTLDAERALYGSRALKVKDCRFDGPADGESAIKECADIITENCYFNLRYPFWHVDGLEIVGCEMTELCRAALWYTEHARIRGSVLHGIKALRECADITIENCDIVSAEFGWSVDGAKVSDTVAQGEYFFMRSRELSFKRVRFKGKYSFQYVENAVFEDCELDTKDAFWHAKNVTLKNCTVKGEYLGWYSENLTMINCKISGTQPLCYCKGLKIIGCTMDGADLSFEKSEVEATVLSPMISIKNPISGSITVPSLADGLILEYETDCRICIGGEVLP